MSLEFAAPPAETTLNALLYGPPGVGKTANACSAPGPILVVNAEPGNPLRFARELHGNGQIHEVPISNKGACATLDSIYAHLTDSPEERTVLVDSVGELYGKVLRDIAGDGRPTLPNYGDATTKVERFCRALIDLPLNVVLIAHEAPVKDEEAGNFERLPVTGTSNPALGVKLMAMVDVVAYCGRKEDDDGTVTYLGQTVTADGRRGKDRTNRLGKFSELDLAEWINKANGGEK